MRTRALNLMIAVLGSVIAVVPVFLLQSVVADVRRHEGREASAAALWVGLGVETLLLLAITAALIWFVGRRTRARVARAVEVPATVISVKETGLQGELESGEYPVVRFVTATGQEIEHVAALHVAGLSAGQEVVVHYDPQDPTWVFVGGGARERAARNLRRIVLGVIALGAVLIAYGLLRWATLDAGPTAQTAAEHRATLDHRRAVLTSIGGIGMMLFGAWGLLSAHRTVGRFAARLDRSQEVSAEVVELVRSTERSKARPTFAFRTFDGRDIRAKSALNYDGRSEIARVPVGAVVRVRYDPLDPSWVTPAEVRPASMRRHSYSPPIILIAMGLFCSSVVLLPS